MINSAEKKSCSCKNMTIQEIQTRKEDKAFDCKGIQTESKALAIPIVAFANADGGMSAIGVSDIRGEWCF